MSRYLSQLCLRNARHGSPSVRKDPLWFVDQNMLDYTRSIPDNAAMMVKSLQASINEQAIGTNFTRFYIQVKIYTFQLTEGIYFISVRK